MNNEICKHGSAAPAKLVADLQHNQGGPGRHKCCVCAFQEGLSSERSYAQIGGLAKHDILNFYKCPHGSYAPTLALRKLQPSQGGVGRHNCAACAFRRGAEVGDSSAAPAILASVNLSLSDPPSSMVMPQAVHSFRVGQHFNAEENHRLGAVGEKIVLAYERSRLQRLGRHDLADQVVHTSAVEGDAVGYDVKSFDDAGSETHIEVKTTTLSATQPFHLSNVQLARSKADGKVFWLYRLFDCNPEAMSSHFYRLNGPLEPVLQMSPTSFQCLPK